MTEKLTLYEYLEELIKKLHETKEKLRPKTLINYSPLAEDLPLSRKDKEKMVELLEEFFPPEKKIFKSVKRKRKHGLFSSYLSLKKMGNLGEKEENQVIEQGEKFFTKLCIKIPLALVMKKDYLKKGGFKRFEKEKEILNFLETTIKNYRPGDFKEIFDEEITEISSCSTKLTGDVHFKFLLNRKFFCVKNFNVSRLLFFHSVISFENFKSIKICEIENIVISSEMIRMLMEYLFSFGKNLEVLKFVKVPIAENCFDIIYELIGKLTKLKYLEFKECEVGNKLFGGICLGILKGRSLKSLKLPGNHIGKFLFYVA